MEMNKFDLNENKYGILPFNGSNFDNWKFRLEAVLSGADVHIVLEPIQEKDKDAEWIKKDNKAKNIIVQSVADSHLEYIKDIKNAAKMLEKLESVFAKKGTCSKFFLLKELVGLKYNMQEDLQHHFAKHDKISRELKSLGAVFSESDMACFLLLSMPIQYENVVTAIRTMSEENDLKLDVVKKRLLEFKNNKPTIAKNKENQISASFVATKSGIKCYRCGKIGHSQNVCGLKCYKCNRFGHKASSCRSGQKQNQNSNIQANFSSSNTEVSTSTNTVQDEVAFLSSLEDNHDGDDLENIIWYVDSGATHHYINNEDMLQNKQYFSELKMIQLAERGKSMLATCSGNIKVKSFVNNKEISIKLENVFCVPGLRVNLLSISKIEKAGFKIICAAGTITILKDNIVYAQGERVNNLYKIKFKLNNESSNANLAVELNNELWHQRYGHLNYDSLLKINNLNLVNGLNFCNNKNKSLCEVCVKSKQRCLSYGSKRNVSKRVLELVHTDICGPITPASHNENRYLVTFIDDFSRFVMVYIIKSKDQVFDCFKHYEAKVVALFCDKSISKIRCDNGGEYSSNIFKDFCDKKGIQISYTPPYTPQLNGVAERMNQTLLDMARSMILQAELDKMFWEEAVLTAAYITNRTQSSINKNKTPYELWFGKKPNVSHMKVFGCIAYARVPDALRSKLDNKGIKCRFVGYSENGYRLWSEEEGRIIHSRNVIFDEKRFTTIKKNRNQDEDTDDFEEEREIDDTENVGDHEEENEINEKEDNEGNDVYDIENDDRPKRNRKMPEYLDDYEVDYSCLALLSNFSEVPKSYTEAKQSRKWEKWNKAIEEELQALQDNNTWKLVDKPSEDENIISNRWVFREKESDEGKVLYKARLVARGFEKINTELSQVHAPVARLSTFRILLSICIKYNLFIEQLDVKNAFLNGIIKEKVYMKLPDGLKVNKKDKNKVCLLNKAIYGLKEAPKIWNDKFNDCMINLRFIRSKSDYCLFTFVYQGIRCYLLLYVDDIIVACNDGNFLKYIKSKLCETFKMKILINVNNFLGINIIKNLENKTIAIDQISAIKNLLKKFNVEECKTYKTPIEKNLNLERNTNIMNKTKLPYKELLGSLMYIMMATRPDICYCVSYFGRFQDWATDQHFNHLLRVLKYLKSTIDLKLIFGSSNEGLIGYSDADWANLTDRKSISGFCFTLFGNLVSWCSKKQSIVALSSTESEFIAVCNASCELLYIKNLLSDFDIDCSLPITLFEDNQSTIRLLKNFENNKRCKYIDVKFHFVVDLISKGIVKIVYVNTNDQLADIFTKSLGHEKFLSFIKRLNLL